jgi:hypothetical protein
MGRGAARTGLGQKGIEDQPLINGVYIVKPRGHNVKGGTEGGNEVGTEGVLQKKKENITKTRG